MFLQPQFLEAECKEKHDAYVENNVNIIAYHRVLYIAHGLGMLKHS